MSPEQIRAQPVDHRSDIFSFGIVLYEMLTGVHPFRKTTQSETTGSILHEEVPPLSRYLDEAPDLLQHTLHKMLAKSPDQRYQTVHEIRTNLEEVRESSGPHMLEAGANSRGQTKPFWTGLISVAVLLVAGAAAVFLGWIPLSGSDQSTSEPLQAVPFMNMPGGAWCPDFSPLGDRIAFHGTVEDEAKVGFDICVKQIGPGDPLPLTTSPNWDRYPCWSPDGLQIAFARWFPDKIAIMTVPALGGLERPIAEVPWKGP